MRRSEDEAALWQAKERGCEGSRAGLIDRYLPLVGATRRRSFPQISPSFGEEMEAEGRLMLVRCVDEFDPGRGVKFSTYAITRLKGAMRDWLRRDDWLTRTDREKIREGQAEEVELVSFEEWLTDHPDRDLPGRGRPVEEIVLHRYQRSLLRALVRCLPAKERHLIVSRYWQEQSQMTLGRALHRCQATVKDREEAALGRLRTWLTRTGALDEQSLR